MEKIIYDDGAGKQIIDLQNLSGNSSWKNGAPEKEVAACE